MFENNNIIAFIFTFLPAFIYSFIVFVATPKFAIKWRIASLFFLMGILSTILVNAVHFMFPNWDSPICDNALIALFFSALIKVGLLEESCKFSTLKLTEWYRNKKYFDHPAAIMFYAMAVSCGFAVSENILYAQMYGGDVLFLRSFSSVIVHMVCGLMMGYFIALGRIEALTKVRMVLYTLVGITFATVYHGLYDFILMAGWGNEFVVDFILTSGIGITYFMAAHLFKYLKKG